MDHTLLRDFIREAVISASPQYMKKERVREQLQGHLLELIRTGEIDKEEDLQEFLASIDMAAKALGSVPIDVWRRMAGM